jgi:ketosteroid isomerase-like protein
MSGTNLIENFNAAIDALLHHPEKVPDCFAEDVLWINYVPEHLPYGGEYRGLDELGKLFAQYVAALDIGKLEFDEYFVTADNVVIVTGMECNSRVKSTDKRYTMPFVWVARFNEHGKINYLREHNDTYSMAEAFKS